MQNLIRSYKEIHCIVIKGTIQQEGITILNMYTLNISNPKLTKQPLLTLKEQIGPDTIIVEDLNTQLSSTDRTSRQNQQLYPRTIDFCRQNVFNKYFTDYLIL
jgi:hypothetical protein